MENIDETIVITADTKERYSIAAYPELRADSDKKLEKLTSEELLESMYLRTQTCKIFIQRYVNACKVIDLISNELGMDGGGRYLYAPGEDEKGNATSPLTEKIQEYIARGGRKAEMKKRIDELENENRVLRSLVQGK